jgi:hypothetical protein
MAEPSYAPAQLIRREALLGAGANAVINAGINAWMLAGKGPHAVTVDSNTAHEATVFGGAVAGDAAFHAASRTSFALLRVD